MNGSNRYEGRLEIRRIGGPWGTIYGSVWTSVHASIACSQMGFSSSVLPPSTTQRFGAATGPVHVNVRLCSQRRHHTSLFECSHTPWDDSEFINNHDGDVELKCMPGKQENKAPQQKQIGPTTLGYFTRLVKVNGVNCTGFSRNVLDRV